MHCPILRPIGPFHGLIPSPAHVLQVMGAFGNGPGCIGYPEVERFAANSRKVAVELSDRSAETTVRNVALASNNRGTFAARVRWDLMMPGVWELKSRSLIHSTLCSGGLQSSSPISFTMAAVI